MYLSIDNSDLYFEKNLLVFSQFEKILPQPNPDINNVAICNEYMSLFCVYVKQL